MSKIIAHSEEIIAIADAIRNSTDSTDKITIADMANRITNIGASVDLNNELTAQDDLISQIMDALRAKGATIPGEAVFYIWGSALFNISSIDKSDAQAITFKEGMTWAEFIASDYNEGNYFWYDADLPCIYCEMKEGESRGWGYYIAPESVEECKILDDASTLIVSGGYYYSWSDI